MVVIGTALNGGGRGSARGEGRRSFHSPFFCTFDFDCYNICMYYQFRIVTKEIFPNQLPQNELHCTLGAGRRDHINSTSSIIPTLK